MDGRGATVFDAGHGKPCPYHAEWWVLPVLLLLGGCAPRRDVPQRAAPDPNLQMTLTVQPASPRQLDPAQFTVTLKDAHNRPVTGANVALNLMMPDMDMGTNTVTLTPRAPGTYAGTGRFTMAGLWSVHANVSTHADNAVQAFPVTVR